MSTKEASFTSGVGIFMLGEGQGRGEARGGWGGVLIVTDERKYL